MSNLNANEQKFIRDFLQLMNDDGIRALTATVTRRMIKVDSVPACVDAIVLHTSSLDEFLKRQKVTKENLFRYLNERKISVPNTDKSALELQIKQLINGPHSGNYGIVHPPQTPPKMPETQTQLLAKPDILNNTTPWTNIVQPIQANTVAVQPVQANTVSPAVQANTVSPAVWNQSTQAGVYGAAVRQVTVEHCVTTVTSTTTNVAGQVLVNLPVPVPGSQETTVTNEFAKWFYPRLNQAPGVLADDFWPDADLKLSVRGGNNTLEKAAQGGASVAKTLNGTLEEHQLFLHPNLSTEGVWGRSNANGLLLVLVCGTLHHRTAHQCLGVFENLFLLAQDPFAADNWKIRTLEAILRSRTQVHQPLTIQESELALSLQ